MLQIREGFYSVHYLPFIIAGLTLIHLALLHRDGSNSPIGFRYRVDDVPFYPYYFSKDLFAFLLSFILQVFVFFLPKFIKSLIIIFLQTMETPKHLVPEWCFFTILCNFTINSSKQQVLWLW
jgi:ubiquinol-cytochrome c reductase cytochrome b subunit